MADQKYLIDFLDSESGYVVSSYINGQAGDAIALITTEEDFVSNFCLKNQLSALIEERDPHVIEIVSSTPIPQIHFGTNLKNNCITISNSGIYTDNLSSKFTLCGNNINISGSLFYNDHAINTVSGLLMLVPEDNTNISRKCNCS